MTQDLQRIRRFVSALVRRERTILVAQVLLQGLLVLLLVVSVAVISSWMRLDRNVAAATLVIVAGVGIWALVAVPLLRSWQHAGDRLRQARLAESVSSAFRGRLVTAVGRDDDMSPTESAAVVELVARRAAVTCETLAPAQVHGARSVYLLALATALCWMLTLPGMMFLPGGISGVAGWWLRGLDAEAAVAMVDLEADSERAWVGDLVLRYTYPDYTGLEPREVSNSTGEASGPPGTRVQVVARTDRSVEAAALVAYDEPALDAVVEDSGRQVMASFTIQPTSGSYHLVLYRDGEPLPSKDFPVLSEGDLPPEVVIERDEETLELSVDEGFSLPWRARDDYGVSKVTLTLDGQQAEILARPSGRRAEVAQSFYGRPRDLGLKAGDSVNLQVVAFDNDTYSGSKQGTSQTIQLVILGPRGVGARTAERQEELRDLMLDILADFLEEPWPAGDTSGVLARWGETVAGRYRPLEDLAMELWGGFEADSVEYRAVMDTMDAAGKLIRYTQVAFEPGSKQTPKEKSFTVTSTLRTDAVVTLEDGILALDRVLRIGALAEMRQQAEVLEEMAASLEELLSKESVDPQEILSRLDQLERMLEQLQREGARLAEGGLREFLNQRDNELKSLLEEIRDALAEGEQEDAQLLMERLTEQIQQMSRGIDENLERMKGDSDDQMENARSLVDELKKLEDGQRNLQAKVQAIREKGDAASAKRASDLWRQLQQGTSELAGKTAEYGSQLEESERPFYEQQRAEQASEEVRSLQDASRARDMRGAREALEMVKRARESMERTYLSEKMMRAELEGPGSPELSELARDLQNLDNVLRQLEEASERVDPAVERETQRLGEEQRQLEGELAHLRKKAMELAQDFPVHPRDMESALEQADSRMQEAGQELGEGKPMQAEGAQGAAAERVKEAREALEDAMQSAQQQMQQGQSRGQEPQGGEESGGGEDKNGEKNQRQALPIPEDHLTPEEYRRALLEGMEGDVPEEYKALKKRYYEELVNL